MPFTPGKHSGRLPRLAPENYRGRAIVHWSMSAEGRATGWLNELHHARVRELLCHALGRYGLICPAYCLMPDHGHFLWMGYRDDSDQRRAAKLVREAWNAELVRTGRQLQRQSHDHVLREAERERHAFSAITHYILENPVRAGLVPEWREYSFLGAVVPGYPSLDPRDADYWEKLWRIHARLVGEAPYP